MKTKPMAHQVTGVERLTAAPDYYALGAEQGTGKTWMLLADAERQYRAGRIDGVFVIAPNGVHVNWIKREIPLHLEVPHVAAFWISGAPAKHAKALERLLKMSESALVICAMNIDAINTKGGYDYAQRFLKRYRSMVIVDESQRIKNPSAKRTKRVLDLEPIVSRRISSGTLVSNSPLDLFSQYEFLHPGLLGTRSYRAFVAEYAELLPPGHPLVQHVARRGTPQIVRRDKDGNPMYRNTDKLSRLIEPHTYRITKDECLDLPPKIYQTHYFDLSAAQMRTYDAVRRDMRYDRPDGDIDVFTALTLINKLRQITSGFIIVDGEPTELKESGPRLAALKELVEDAQEPIIIWATFREELRRIAEAFPGCVQYHGGTSAADRERAVDDFQSGRANIFVANPAAAGTGLTLHSARTVIYYSCSFSLEERLQSEDRAHRIGTRHPVLYIDMVARDTIDERIAAALQAKAGVAAEILDFDRRLDA